MSNTRNWGSMHSEFACEFIVWSNYDHSTLDITFCSPYKYHKVFGPKKFEFHAGVKKIFSNFSSMFLNPNKFFKFVKEYSLMKFIHKVPLLRPTAFSSR